MYTKLVFIKNVPFFQDVAFETIAGIVMEMRLVNY